MSELDRELELELEPENARAAEPECGTAEQAVTEEAGAEQAENGTEAPKEPTPEEMVAAAEKKTEEYIALAQRIQADFENYRRRNETARADAFEDGRRSVAAAMLGVLDNLERAVDAAADVPDDDPIKSGVALTLHQLRDTFEKLGVTAIDRLGEAFDPTVENAVLQGSEEDGEPGTVCAVLQKGYLMGKVVLRPAMVKVVPE